MPEGDSILRAAHTLGQALRGQNLAAVWSRDGRPKWQGLVGRTIEDVTARGKHLFVLISGNRAIQSHMGMKGRWRTHVPFRFIQSRPDLELLQLAQVRGRGPGHRDSLGHPTRTVPVGVDPPGSR